MTVFGLTFTKYKAYSHKVLIHSLRGILAKFKLGALFGPALVTVRARRVYFDFGPTLHLTCNFQKGLFKRTI